MARRAAGLFCIARTASLAGSLFVGAPFALAAPPDSATDFFDAPFRKTAADYDRMGGASGEARARLEAGLTAFARYDYALAKSEFDASLAASPSYAARFDQALVSQVTHKYGDAQSMYGAAGRVSPNDPELEANLATVLAAQDKYAPAMAAFDRALTLAPDAGTRGRILYRRALLELEARRLSQSSESFGQADDAFRAAGDEHGQAMVAAQRGSSMLESGDPDGEALLLGATARLQSLGALVDETNARASLIAHYLESGQIEKAEPQLRRGLEAAEAAKQPKALGRIQFEMGTYQLRSRNLAEAKNAFERAVSSFRKAQDPVRESEANDDLGSIALASGSRDQGFHAFDESVRSLRRAGAMPRAFDTALSVASVFHRAGDPRSEEYFLDMARKFAGDLKNPAAEQRALLAFARYHLAKGDTDAAEGELRQANSIAALDDAGKLNPIDLLDDELKSAQRGDFFRTALMAVLAGCGLVLLYETWPRLRAALVWAGGVAAAPVGWAARGFRRLSDWWTVAGQTQADDEDLDFERRVKQIFIALFVGLTVLLVVLDFYLTTLPTLRFVFDSKKQVENLLGFGVIPIDISDRLQPILTRVALYVGAVEVVDIVLMALGLLFAFALSGVVETLVFGALRRWLGQYGLPSDPGVRVVARKALKSQYRYMLRTLPALLALGGAVFFQWISFPTASYGFLFALAIAEIVLFVRLRRELAPLTDPERAAAYGYVARIGINRVATVFVGFFAFAYVLLPFTYFVIRKVEETLIFPMFAGAEAQALHDVKVGVMKYGLLVFDESILAFSRLSEAYDPSRGARFVWSDYLDQLFLPAFLLLTLLTISRWFAPTAEAIGPRDRIWKTLKAALIGTLVGLFLDPFLDRAFHLDGRIPWEFVTGFAALFGIFVEHAVATAGGGGHDHGSPHGGPAHGPPAGANPPQPLAEPTPHPQAEPPPEQKSEPAPQTQSEPAPQPQALSPRRVKKKGGKPGR